MDFHNKYTDAYAKRYAKALQNSLLTYALARSAVFQAESFMGPAIELAVNRRRPHLLTDDPDLFRKSREAHFALLKEDVQRIVDGVYPIEVLAPENPLKHFLRLPEMVREGIGIAFRRRDHQAHRFNREAKELLEGLPEYYQRNFHFQPDGYLSEKSARLYEHQVEVLFAGAADAMRRLIIAPLKNHFADHPQGEGLHFLEVGAGTGRGTRFVRLAFPKAKITLLDLSDPYLKRAQTELAEFTRTDFVQGDAAKLPFLDEKFDAVYSIFLFHELPMKPRKEVIAEAWRVLKPSGFQGLVDSLQLGDAEGLDEALTRFPIQFHEPFYKNYIEHPMEELLSADSQTEIGFFSKAVFASKP